MKEFAVYVDITVSNVLYVEAESEEEASKIAKEMVEEEPYYYSGCACTYVGCEVYEAVEEVPQEIEEKYDAEKDA